MVSENVPAPAPAARPSSARRCCPGLLRCRRCGRKLTVQYTGAKGQIPRYACVAGGSTTASRTASPSAACASMTRSRRRCSPSCSPPRVEAALAAEAQASVRRDEAREAMVRDLEAARYAADRAFRQYDAADPENRLVAGELEARWNRALARVGRVRGAHRRA